MITVRLSNIYGPTPLVRYDLIHVLCRTLLAEGRAKVWSTRPERDFIYVEDVAAAVVKLLESDFAGTLNLGTGILTPVRRVVELLRELSGCPIEDEGVPVQGPMRFQCDRTTIDRIIEWQPLVGVDEGVRRTWEAMRSYAAR